LTFDSRGHSLREDPDEVLIVRVTHLEDEVDKVLGEAGGEEVSAKGSAEVSSDLQHARARPAHSLFTRLSDAEDVGDSERL
jgi:hypothetical protein